MTKKEMVTEIVNSTRIGNKESAIIDITNKVCKAYIALVYEKFMEDKSHSLFYYGLLVGYTL